MAKPIPVSSEIWGQCELACVLSRWAAQNHLALRVSLLPDDRLLIHDGFYVFDIVDPTDGAALACGLSYEIEDAAERLVRRLARLQGCSHVPGLHQLAAPKEASCG